MPADIIYTQRQDEQWEARFEDNPKMVAVGKTKDEAHNNLMEHKAYNDIMEILVGLVPKYLSVPGGGDIPPYKFVITA